MERVLAFFGALALQCALHVFSSGIPENAPIPRHIAAIVACDLCAHAFAVSFVGVDAFLPLFAAGLFGSSLFPLVLGPRTSTDDWTLFDYAKRASLVVGGICISADALGFEVGPAAAAIMAINVAEAAVFAFQYGDVCVGIMATCLVISVPLSWPFSSPFYEAFPQGSLFRISGNAVTELWLPAYFATLGAFHIHCAFFQPCTETMGHDICRVFRCHLPYMRASARSMDVARRRLRTSSVVGARRYVEPHGFSRQLLISTSEREPGISAPSLCAIYLLNF